MAKKSTKKSSAPAPRKSAAKAAPAPAPKKRPIRREVGAVVCFVLGLLTLIGYFNLDAWFVTIVCRFIKGIIGYGYIVFPPVLLVISFILAFHRGNPVALRVTCASLITVMFGSMAHVIFSRVETEGMAFGEMFKLMYTTGGEMKSGGIICGFAGLGMEKTFSPWGAVPILLLILIILVMVVFRISPAKMAQKAKEHEKIEYTEEDKAIGNIFLSQAEERAERASKPITNRDEYIEYGRSFNEIFGGGQPVAPQGVPVFAEEKKTARERRAEKKAAAEVAAVTKAAQAEVDNITLSAAARAIPRFDHATLERNRANDVRNSVRTTGIKPLSIEEAGDIAGVEPVEINSAAEEPVARKSQRPRMDKLELEQETAAVEAEIHEGEIQAHEEYRYPSPQLLRSGIRAAGAGREELEATSARLQSTLDSFGVNARITDITRGPSVTRFDLELEAGVKLTKIVNLSGDIALALGVSNVRVAPIPDKQSTVGIEVPNKLVSTVYLRDMLESSNFKNSASKLTFAIGEDIEGNCIVGNIAKLPHLLIAGTTGSGKSVFMNGLILSLLYKSTPEEVRLVMIDPKMVELGIYNGIPHLYIPVVTEPKKAAGSLQWAVVEMLKRYRLFSEDGVREITAYNNIRRQNGEDILPYVVIVIDELADLMMAAAKEVEESICRLAQMGRAAGMHLVVATQRPSADVITGLMKANIPSRLSFAVASSLDSRIILDVKGAETLLGNGDLLYSPIGIGKPVRVQGAFVTDEERENVINFIKQNGSAHYNEDIIAQIEENVAEKDSKGSGKAESATAKDDSLGDVDDMLPEAVNVILETKQASVSLLQRRLKLGYSRAARIVDQMEELGVVGPFEGSKPRQILVTREQWEEMQGGSGRPVSAQMHMDEYTDDDPEEWQD